MELQGKSALISGAGSTGGIGFQIAAALLREGAQVIISGRDESRGREAAAQLGEDVRFTAADLTDLDSVRALAEQAGPVDVLVNNAAISHTAHTTVQEADAFDTMFATNVRGPYFLTAALVPHMIARGGGAIVNVSSLAATRGTPNLAAYGASKAAVEALTRGWAAEFASANVRVNAVAPGATGSEKVTGKLGKDLEAVAQTIPLARIGRTTEAAEAVLFLASDRAEFITGTVLPVDGGRTVI